MLSIRNNSFFFFFKLPRERFHSLGDQLGGCILMKSNVIPCGAAVLEDVPSFQQCPHIFPRSMLIRTSN